MIQIEIPSFSYAEELILKDVKLELSTGMAHGIVGLNGAGKTTFFQLLAGFLKAKDSLVLKNRAAISKKSIAYIDTELFFYPKLTAREFLSVFKSGSVRYSETELAEIFKIPLDNLIEEFSTGMKKKLLLMSQIKQDKDIYILDEPFNGLDLETNKLLEIIIAVLTDRGKTVFISSHILEPLIHLCHSIHFLKEKTVFKSYAKENFGEVAEDLFGSYTRDVEKRLPEII